MSVRELVLLIFWGISCILITVQIIKIRKEKARIPDMCLLILHRLVWFLMVRELEISAMVPSWLYVGV